MMRVCSNKSKKVALCLCVLFGLAGIHDFYLGKWGKGFLKLITFNIFGIGWIIDMVKIATDSYADFAGLPVVK